MEILQVPTLSTKKGFLLPTLHRHIEVVLYYSNNSEDPLLESSGDDLVEMRCITEGGQAKCTRLLLVPVLGQSTCIEKSVSPRVQANPLAFSSDTPPPIPPPPKQTQPTMTAFGRKD